MNSANTIVPAPKTSLLMMLPVIGLVVLVLMQSSFSLVPSLTAVLLGVSAIPLSFMVYRHFNRIIDTATVALEHLATGDLNEHAAIGSSREGNKLEAALDQLRKTLREGHHGDAETNKNNNLTLAALNSVNKPIMIADDHHNIVFLNRSAQVLFDKSQQELRTELPHFDAAKLLGSNIDIFHKDPAHQRAMLSKLQSTHVIDIRFGGLMLQITANPLFSGDGERIGAVVEWLDRTQEIGLEDEIKSVVDSALAGDLSRRIVTDESADDFFSLLSSGVNKLMALSDGVIENTVRVFSAMAKGELTETIQGDFEGSFGELKSDANTTVHKLTEVVGDIQVSASSVKSSADQISQGNLNLSHRTEQQAASLEETASSMEEMTTTVQQNAENAGQANELAKEAQVHAQQGGMVVSDAVKAMAEINNSSKKIAEIISVIDEIAFQTNLLALNASVEAARAGEQGRGFAVVASEVRNLAGRSATAAKEIKELIQDSGHKVEEGSRLVNESGEVLEEIVNGVKKVTDIIGEITSASQEQAAGIVEVNRAITQMDEFTQQNAALVEEAAAASESLGEEADGLNELIQFFTVNELTGARNFPGHSPAPHHLEANGENGSWTQESNGLRALG